MSSHTETPTRRRRVRVTPLRAIPVGFTGRRAAEGPLTLGQLSLLGWLDPKPDEVFAILCVELEVPGGVSVDDVAEAVAVLLGRHESLRTSYLVGEHPRQRVTASGVVMLDVCALGDGSWGPRDRPAVAEALTRWLRAQQRPHTTPLPIRVAVATGTGDDGHAERVIACAAAFSHVAVDHAAIEIVKREFGELVRDPSARRIGEPRHQPLDQAALEATPAARRQAETALRYVRDQLERIPRCLYLLPGTRNSGESLAVELSSVAAAMALRQVAGRTRASRSSIVLAAICAVIARRTGYRELVVPLMSSNRFERHLTGYVGPLAQPCIATIEVGTHTFDELARQTWTSVIDASRHGRYDAAKRTEMEKRIEHERGLRLGHDALFNSLVPESWSAVNAGVEFRPEQVHAALQETELRWRPVPRHGTPIRFSLNQVEGRLQLELWTADTGQVPRAELDSLLLAVERLLVATADTDLDTERISDVIGIDPITRGPNWILVDSCWVDLTEVQRLLDEALTPATARIFPSTDGRSLVAHLTATTSIRTPAQAHTRCMAALPHHPSAITPHHYVIHQADPPNPADPTARHAPLSTGTGRAP